MNQEDLWREWSVLPPLAQQEVIDFIAFLQQKYDALPRAEINATPVNEADWLDSEFVGLWADRVEMSDSTAWVRQLRDKDWT